MTKPPKGWIPCNGQSISKAQYPNIFKGVINPNYTVFYDDIDVPIDLSPAQKQVRELMDLYDDSLGRPRQKP